MVTKTCTLNRYHQRQCKEGKVVSQVSIARNTHSYQEDFLEERGQQYESLYSTVRLIRLSSDQEGVYVEEA